MVDGGVEQKIVSDVFTDTKIQTFPWTMFCRTPINISEAMTWSIKPTGGIFTLLSLKFSIFSPYTQELTAKKGDRAIVLATVP